MDMHERAKEIAKIGILEACYNSRTTVRPFRNLRPLDVRANNAIFLDYWQYIMLPRL